MGKLLVILLLLAGAGVPAYFAVRGTVIDFDVTSTEQPLGAFDRVEPWLTGKEYEADSRGQGRFAGPEGTKRHRYKETYAAESGQFLCYVDLYVDSKGQVRKLIAEFPSRSREIDASYTKTQGLAFSLWTRLSGSPPTLVTDNISPVHEERGLRSDLDNGRVKATWIKTYTDRDRLNSIVDTVTFERK